MPDLLIIMSAFFTASGYMCLKFAHNKMALSKTEKSACCNFTWLLGLFLMCASSAVYTVALALGSQILLASNSAMIIIISSVLSVICLKERLLRIDMFGICLTCVGSILFMLQTKQSNDKYDRQSLFYLFCRPISIGLISFTFLTIIFVYRFDKQVKTKLKLLFQTLSLKDDQQHTFSTASQSYRNEYDSNSILNSDRKSKKVELTSQDRISSK